MPSPDFTGFEGAQVRLRAAFGRTVEFFAPEPTIYPPGTRLDPETGRPFDPTIRPLSSGFTMTTASANVVDRPFALGLDGQREATALGFLTDADKVLILASGDVALASGAERATYMGEEFKVSDFVHDSLGPVERYLIFLRRR